MDFAGIRKLTIVEDGFASTVPFAALQIDADGTYAAETITIQLMAPVFSESSPNQNRKALIFDDPIFSELPRLRSSAQEGDKVQQELESIGYNAQRYSGMDAMKSNFLRSDLLQQDVIHLATHGIGDHEHSRGSGIWFAAAEDEFLSVSEVYDLELKANLVVLSACESAVGTQVDGEMSFSLAQAFLVAGAKNVLVSSWPVDDRATSGLLQAYYKYWTDGEDAAVALQKAQSEMLGTGRWRNPYFWSGFSLISVGEN